ncbi:hypothetical protein CEUSTIGMA_g5430.t1 [Chlamydomonas eustigma]|uniref:Transmembrane protein n=1 Tax=Chlamydomonas eustigma TaxID=1157962 RepID=A0A250X4I0_9CHLO|nr:hypothetical protein CEUSTIGMA_g5430.t1 [Chlamydomonas eustigma]|eukprot:GAX77988.1 hypothetical protein CEUSTIGMA_g5430.t1 [Chlamydomonas eustigma]
MEDQDVNSQAANHNVVTASGIFVQNQNYIHDDLRSSQILQDCVDDMQEQKRGADEPADRSSSHELVTSFSTALANGFEGQDSVKPRTTLMGGKRKVVCWTPPIVFSSNVAEITIANRADILEAVDNISDDEEPFSPSYLVSRISKSFTHLVHSLHQTALGDDHTVQDRWEDEDNHGIFANQAQEVKVARVENFDGEISSGRSDSLNEQHASTVIGIRKIRCMGGANKIMPMLEVLTDANSLLSGGDDMVGRKKQPIYSDHVGASFGSLTDSLKSFYQEKKETRTLLWYYIQILMYSATVAAFCLPVIGTLSVIKWHVVVEPITANVSVVQIGAVNSALNTTLAQGPPASVTPSSTLNTGVNTFKNHPETSPFRPNDKALQLMLIFQLIFPLVLYALCLYICICKTFKIPRALIIAVTFTASWSLLACGLIYAYDFSFWFYYVDLFMIVAAYVPCMCVVGWYIEQNEETSTRDRFIDMLYVALLEALVAVATLIYCFFIMPLFFTLTNAWLQLMWLCVVHPLYFEVTTGFLVRKVLYRNRALGRTDVVYFLTIVHSMVHSVALSTSLQASIEPVRILAVTLLIYNISKLTWRSTVIPRDLFVERLLHGWSYNFGEQERFDLARMVSVGILTEIILENASVIVSPFLLYRMYNEPLFMSVVPNTFFNNGGGYPVQTLLSLIAILFAFTFLFDLIFLFLNYYTSENLPIINTWRRIKKAGFWYMGFMIYAYVCMGILFLFLTMLILPRAVYCDSNEYCDCRTSTYAAICKGEYISMLVDYLIEPYGSG